MKALPLSALAERDLDEIAEYTAKQSPAAAVRLTSDLIALCERIVDGPLAYPAQEHVRPGLRRAVHHPYLVYFLLDGRGIRIERIVHGARDLTSLF